MTNELKKQELPSKKQMLKAIMEKSNKNDDGINYYDLRIMSKAYVTYVYRAYILGENVGEYEW